MPATAGPAQATLQPPPLNDQMLGTPLTNRSKAPQELAEGRASFSWSGWFFSVYQRFFYQRLSVRIITADTTLTNQDSTVIAQINAQALVTLTDATDLQGQIYTLKNDKWSSANMVLNSSQGQTVDRVTANQTILHPGDTIVIQSDGSDWIIVSLYTTFVVNVP